MKSQQKEDKSNSERFLFGLVLFDTKHEDTKIEKAIESLLKIDYPANKLKIIVSSYAQKTEEGKWIKDPTHYVNYTNILLQKFRHTRLLINNPLEMGDIIDYNAFILCRHADYLVRMNHDQTITPDFFKNVSIENPSKEIIFQQNSIAAIPRSLVSKNYLEFNNYENMEEHLKKEAHKNELIKNII